MISREREGIYTHQFIVEVADCTTKSKGNVRVVRFNAIKDTKLKSEEHNGPLQICNVIGAKYQINTIRGTQD